MPSIDYGYGDDNEEPDYGYGDEPVEDYGYGDAGADEDYGYGDVGPDAEDLGYEETEVAKPAEPKNRPKRRCSVTKFNLDNDSALTAADRIREMRHEDSNVSAPPVMNHTPADDRSTDGQSTDGLSTDGMSTDGGGKKKSSSKSKSSRSKSKDKEKPPVDADEKGEEEGKAPPDVKKKGALSRMRKRLSLAF